MSTTQPDNGESDYTDNEQYGFTPSGEWDSLDDDRHPISGRMIGERYDPSTVGEFTPPSRIVTKYQNFGKEGGSRPSIVNHQVPEEVTQAIQSEVELNLLYRFERGQEEQAAWQIGDTTQAIVISKLDGEVRMRSLPYLGEANMDLRWMLVHTLSRGDEFSITHCSDETLESILKTTRPEDAPGMEQLIYSQCAEDCNQPAG